MKIWSASSRAVAAMGVMCIVLAGCSSPKSDSPGSGGSGAGAALPRDAVNKVATPSKATDGGTLRLLDYNSHDNLDSATTTNGGNTDTVREAIYDTLVRYDYDAKKWAPQLAESLAPSEGGKSWKLTLREGVKFTDGTPLDAQAVVAHLKRKTENAQGFQKTLLTMITGFDISDPRTVVFTLAAPWTEFPYLLATDAGCITSPSAVRSSGEKFKENPVGAGPFKVAKFVPGQKVSLVRNDGYWGGKPHLDGVDFTAVASASLGMDQLKTGAADVIHVQSADSVIKAKKAGNPGWIFKSDAGVGLQVNATRAPGSDESVRQAIAYAINYDTVNKRVAPGAGLYGSSLLASDSALSASVNGVSYDLAKAKKLVADAKERLNWDGKLTYVALGSSPAYSQTIRAMLDAAGFKVDLVQSTDPNSHVQRVYVKQDFDIADSSLNVWDNAPWSTFTAGVGIASMFGIDAKNLNTEIGALRSVADEAAQKKALDAIQELWNKEQPFVVTGVRPYGFFWAKSVHGVVPNAGAAVLLDKAFIAK